MGIGGGIGFTPLQGAVGAARCSAALKEGGSCSPAVTAGIVQAGSPHQAEKFSSFFYFLHQGRAFPLPLFPPRMCIPLPIPLPRPQPHASGSISHTKAQKKQNRREQKAPGSRVTALASQRSVFNALHSGWVLASSSSLEGRGERAAFGLLGLRSSTRQPC